MADMATTKRDRSTALLLTGPSIVVMFLLLVLPLLTLLRYSFNRFSPQQLMIEAFTLENYIKFFAEPYFRSVMYSTFSLAAICTVASVALGYPVAYMLARSHSRWKSILIILVLFPLLVGNVVRAAGWTIFLSRDGFLNYALMSLGITPEPLQFMYTNTAVFIGLMSVMMPFVILTLLGVLEGLDFSLFDAAQNLGATPATAFRRVIFPLSIPGISAASVIVFTIAMNSYATPVLLGGPEFKMMAPVVYQQFALILNWPFGAALAFILIAVTGAASAISSIMLARQNRLLTRSV
jgi:putative spermidine/putrescine transport system permease protein